MRCLGVRVNVVVVVAHNCDFGRANRLVLLKSQEIGASATFEPGVQIPLQYGYRLV